MKIHVEFDSIKEMDEWVARVAQPVTNNVVIEQSVTDPTATEEKPKTTRKRKASKPKVVKDEPKKEVEEVKEEAPQVPANTPFIEDEKVAEHTDADAPAETEAPVQEDVPAEKEVDEPVVKINSPQDMVSFLATVLRDGSDKAKSGLRDYAGGLPQFITVNLQAFAGKELSMSEALALVESLV